MSYSTIAKRYALALFEIAQEHNQLEAIEEELRAVKAVFLENKELSVLFENPKLTLDKKKAIIQEAFSTASPYVSNTLMLLTDRHRTDQIVGLVDAFIEQANEAHGVADATVYSVRPLSEDEQKALSSSFAKKVGKQSLRITNVTDENLLGGIKVQIGTRIYDGSLQGKLTRLERELIR
ncbi:F0F1 ATP synthase subunit delta [Rossellomorea aquimaris]|uniref:F0F1 ATP synthase subunit delta n=1 Tax=Rossellomorea aquimaris TaxID=189382 RepID=UPI0007D075E2|nr:F0F1 ATP synthase subunit delta [Rossellomorea aquimaris]